LSKRFERLELEESKRTETSPVQQLSTASETRDSAYWLRLADQNRRQGLFEEALRLYSRAVELDRSMVVGWVGQVRMLIALEEFPEAELWARKALELFRNQADLAAGRAQALCRNGELQQAQATCDVALAQQGQSYYPWLVRGDLMLARKNGVAEHCFDKVVQLSSDWLTLIDVAEIYLYYHLHAKALQRCQQALTNAMDQPYVWYLQGQCESAMGMSDAARRSFKHCLDLEPRYERARVAMESATTRRGWWSKLFGGGK
jgi:tetratricopeptide (TPR) repeat protein